MPEINNGERPPLKEFNKTAGQRKEKTSVRLQLLIREFSYLPNYQEIFFLNKAFHTDINLRNNTKAEQSYRAYGFPC